jgi:hypothetical protein
MADPVQELQTLARRLAEATTRDAISWTKSGDAGFVTSMPPYSISIRSVDDDGHPPYRMAILDERAVELSALEWEAERTQYNTVIEKPQNNDLAVLYAAARGSVVDVGAIVREILAAFPQAPQEEGHDPPSDEAQT